MKGCCSPWLGSPGRSSVGESSIPQWEGKRDRVQQGKGGWGAEEQGSRGSRKQRSRGEKGGGGGGSHLGELQARERWGVPRGWRVPGG